jgi:acyl-CoA synthetase (AMP-forming)/AMP-acid ligase II
MSPSPGFFYQRLAEAVASSGSPRSVYSQDTTLSRRGLLTRGDRRARELTALGVSAGDIVALSMGNVVELLVMLIATSKLGAVAMPVDPANGDRMLLDATSRLRVRAVVRRPRGSETEALDYPDGYRVTSRKRLSGSLLTVDGLEPPDDLEDVSPPEAELVLEAGGIGGTMRSTFFDAPALLEIGKAAVEALELDPGSRLLCAQPLVVPRFFGPVVLGWLASEAQLVMAEGPALNSVLPIARSYDKLVVFDSVRQFVELARGLRSTSSSLTLTPVIGEATVSVGFGRAMEQVFGERPRQLLLLEECGVLASRVMARGEKFEAPTGVELAPGDAMTVGGHEVLVRYTHPGFTTPEIPAGEPGSTADDGFLHTGYAGRWSKTKQLTEVIGRDDGLVNLEGRRACLDRIEDAILDHRRVTWVRALLDYTEDGEPEVSVEYVATGQTEVEDIEEHAIALLPPFMIPRRFDRLEAPEG